MTAWLQHAILRCAACVTPKPQRAEWLAEWRSELWHARRKLRHHEATAFCWGAFRDAFWLRREGFHWTLREAVNLDSPGRCLGLLAALDAISLLVASCIPYRPSILQSASQGLFSVLVVAVCVILSSTSLSLGGYRANRRRPSCWTRLRRWVFLAAKIALILPIASAPMRYMVYVGATNPGRNAAGLVAQFLLWGMVFGLRWTIQDQRNRCPVCLRKLADPVRVGQAAGYFLDWNCTELMCMRGHGMLYVPECRTSWFDTPRWLYLDASWSAPNEPAGTGVDAPHE